MDVALLSRFVVLAPPQTNQKTLILPQNERRILLYTLQKVKICLVYSSAKEPYVQSL